jgi:trk system potassium uptake protein TrkH
LRISIALHIAGVVNIILSVAMLSAIPVAVFYNDGGVMPLTASFLITLATGLILFFTTRGAGAEVSHREGFLVVGVSWISAGLLSSLPFIFSGLFPSIVDCIFEATSGITTTGASIITDIEALPHALIFWRSLIHWLGGMGIVVLSLAILPLLGIGGMQIYKAEASTISGDKFVPRIKDMARILMTVYLIFSFVMVVLLMLAGMGPFDAFIHTVGGVATAGFSSKNNSIAFFNSFTIEWIIMIFMVLGATNFALHHGFFRNGIKVYTRNEEFRFYIFVMLSATVLITINLAGTHYSSVGEALRFASFQAVSITTTTGFTSADYGQWPFFSQFILLSLMFIGGSVGSTTGSLKCVRFLLLIKLAYKEISQLIHPHAIVPVKLNGRVVPPEIMKSVVGFTFLFFMVFALSSLALLGIGLDPITAISSSAATIGNVGPALGLTGPSASYAMIPDAGKWILILNMFLGRLEIYTLIILLIPAFWRG